jgi:hypothetical protein
MGEGRAQVRINRRDPPMENTNKRWTLDSISSRECRGKRQSSGGGTALVEEGSRTREGLEVDG